MENVTKILNGSGIAQDIRMELRAKIADSRTKPGLAVILVGHDPASRMYIDFKKQASQEVGLYLETYEFEEDVKQKTLVKLIDKLNKNRKIHGILVQLPLPEHIEDIDILQRIDPAKDVDGFHPTNVGLLAVGYPALTPATPKGIMRLIASTGVDLRGKDAVVIGASNIVGKPTAQLLLNERATVTIANSLTRDLRVHTRKADVIVVAVGKPNLITADMVKEGVIVIDAGINKVGDRVVGDVDYENVSKLAAFITPVPGGVGPMTVAMLLENTWEAMRHSKGHQE
ncbi:MAG: bifunctional methylenetetrahydrofolate dehydrogenase/methenyltetrahydrofolate cyclohydrolase [Candidatus Kerfeldbacteria bacterium RIFCSPHIGHO2_12_FULL_48_17]|uniref:Bifunctional protein FolD n=1 Tax=Candidatus Kerfeldbacteria bacterium RIFCSPHIGHO2_12_FULL_48_17 TaxID=1798542 RepID=A0A1G2B548_9BACT|nr:MAG: bifunctional methylenetetrahydrofolate dehydrogenase/methenyltetrahydrofolate cyclohydrolase [Candidatus Kerfeldbacteria bacterium RIFCSPHIGHO2_12_FULL_48_17]